MSKSLKSLFSSSKFMLFIGLLIGATGSFIGSHFYFKSHQSTENSVENKDKRQVHRDAVPKSWQKPAPSISKIQDRIDKQFKRMEKQMEQMLGGSGLGFGGPSFFDDDMNLGLSLDSKVNDLKVQSREDDKFLYFEILADNLNEKSLKIDVENDRLTIKGETLQEQEENGSGLRSLYRSSSTFMQSYKLPREVDSAGMKVLKEEGRIVVKIPKSPVV